MSSCGAGRNIYLETHVVVIRPFANMILISSCDVSEVFSIRNTLGILFFYVLARVRKTNDILYHDMVSRSRRRSRSQSRSRKRPVVYLSKSTRSGKKYMVVITPDASPTGRQRTVHFGQSGASDYTKHKDSDRKQRYVVRHKRGNEKWTKRGITTAGFWSRWLLWNKPTISASTNDIQKKFGIRIIRKRAP